MQISTAAEEDVARFSAIADEWWNPLGKFKPLHDLNPSRIAYIRYMAAAHFKRDADNQKPLKGLDVLDIGCGGGLLSEPIKTLGANVTGIDASAKNINVASLHAQQSGLKIKYENILPEQLARQERHFDIVLNMEIVEHVANLDAFLKATSKLLKPGGTMFISTMNRTMKSFMLGKIAAEYILHWLPAGTHDWNKFVKPSELVTGLGHHGVEVTDLKGVSYNPFKQTWAESDDLQVNYMAFAIKNRKRLTECQKGDNLK